MTRDEKVPKRKRKEKRKKEGTDSTSHECCSKDLQRMREHRMRRVRCLASVHMASNGTGELAGCRNSLQRKDKKEEEVVERKTRGKVPE